MKDKENRSTMQEIHDREQDWCDYLFFQQNGQDLGFDIGLGTTLAHID